MAKVVVKLVVEMDLVVDAIRDIERIFGELATCHGSPYRELQGRIERLIEEPGLFDCKMQPLGSDRLVATPTGAIAAIIEDARQLGVI